LQGKRKRKGEESGSSETEKHRFSTIRNLSKVHAKGERRIKGEREKKDPAYYNFQHPDRRRTRRGGKEKKEKEKKREGECGPAPRFFLCPCPLGPASRGGEREKKKNKTTPEERNPERRKEGREEGKEATTKRGPAVNTHCVSFFTGLAELAYPTLARKRKGKKGPWFCSIGLFLLLNLLHDLAEPPLSEKEGGKRGRAEGAVKR